MERNTFIADLVNKKIEEIDNLLVLCDRLPKNIGSKRLENKFVSERKVLLKYAQNIQNINEDHLKSSNVSHLSSVLWSALTSPAVVQILKPVVIANETSSCRIFVDVVADSGLTWIKVVARNPQAILQSEIGAVSYGRKTLAKQVEQLKECAQRYCHFYEPPHIKVLFTAGVLPEIRDTLEKIGVEVLDVSLSSDQLWMLLKGSMQHETLHEFDHFTEYGNNTSQLKEVEEDLALCDLKLNQVPPDAQLNLDVSTMIAYVSSLTNGYCNFRFQSEIMSEQAKCECENPVKPVLDELFTGRKLICCETAFRDFAEIVKTIGGNNEKSRTEKFLKTVEVVNDQPSARVLSLEKSCKVKHRPQVVFGTGDMLQAITVTANKGFLRAAKAQDVAIVAFLHESRALTESMEETAIIVDNANP